MKPLVVLMILSTVSACPTFAAPGPLPAPSNIPGAEYPRIEEDSRVAFRLTAREARRVQVRGGTGLVGDALELRRGEDGVWTGSTRPAAPGFHYYWFVVDGLTVNDPSSYSYFGYGRETSGVEVPEAGVDFYEPRDGVPAGEVRTRWYHSGITEKWRRVNIYTPPGYDRDPAVRYPVLYLLHGAGENDRGWIEQGRASFILDNLIAGGRCVPMIAVVDSGYAVCPSASGGPSPGPSAPTSAFEAVMIQELIPFIDTTFRTRPDRQHRAMAGLSMGAMQTLQISLSHLNQFAWIGAMSAPPRQPFDVRTAYDGVFNDAAAFNAQVALFWLGAGTGEVEFHRHTMAMHEALEGAGIRNAVFSSPGTDHEWQTWRRSLHDLAPRLFQP
jgi:enterochelin esterase-like enzyme